MSPVQRGPCSSCQPGAHPCRAPRPQLGMTQGGTELLPRNLQQHGPHSPVPVSATSVPLSRGSLPTRCPPTARPAVTKPPGVQINLYFSLLVQGAGINAPAGEGAVLHRQDHSPGTRGQPRCWTPPRNAPRCVQEGKGGAHGCLNPAPGDRGWGGDIGQSSRGRKAAPCAPRVPGTMCPV